MSRPAHREENGPPQTEWPTMSRMADHKQKQKADRLDSQATSRHHKASSLGHGYLGLEEATDSSSLLSLLFQCDLLSINSMTEVNFSICLWPTSCLTWIKHLVVVGQQDAHTNIHHVYRPRHRPCEVVWKHQERGDPRSSCQVGCRD